jgi:hypothetical protein
MTKKCFITFLPDFKDKARRATDTDDSFVVRVDNDTDDDDDNDVCSKACLENAVADGQVGRDVEETNTEVSYSKHFIFV